MSAKETKQTLGRRMIDIAQKARGRTALRYEFELVPYFAGELPAGVERVLFAWERGAKRFSTDAEPVNPHTRAVFWRQYLKQQATMYKDGQKIQAKEFSFKIQSVKTNAKGQEEHKTLGKLKVDLSQFCLETPEPTSQEVFLQLKPAGKLKISIKATWLKDAIIDPDQLTEVTGATRSEAGALLPEDEQDLTGFEDLGDGASVTKQGSVASGSVRGLAAHSITADSVSTATAPGPPKVTLVEKTDKKRDKKRGGAGPESSPAKSIPGAIPGGFDVPLSPEEQRRREEERSKKRDAEMQQREDKLREEVYAQARLEFLAELEASKVCCCWLRRPKERFSKVGLLSQEGAEMSAIHHSDNTI